LVKGGVAKKWGYGEIHTGGGKGGKKKHKKKQGAFVRFKHQKQKTRGEKPTLGSRGNVKVGRSQVWQKWGKKKEPLQGRRGGGRKGL